MTGPVCRLVRALPWCAASALSATFWLGACAQSEPSAEPGGNGANSGNGANGGTNGTAGGQGNGSGGGSSADGGTGLPPSFQACAADTFTTGLTRSANIVWVIDTSGSMDEEAALVQQNMNAFVQSIVGAGLADYRVVVVSEREFVNVPEPLASDGAHFLMVEEEVGSNEPLEDLLSRYDDFDGFLLPGAITHYVVVTDDESDLPANEFISQMRSRLGATEFRVHAIASPPGAQPPSAPMMGSDPFEDLFGGDDEDTGCVGAYGDAAAAGVENYAAATMTNGLKFSICEADWSGLFSALASAVGQSATIPCSLRVPTESGGAPTDPQLINVVLNANSAGDRVQPKVQSSGACTAEGWFYDDPAAPTTINLCPQSCDLVRSNAVLKIAVGCATTVL